MILQLRCLTLQASHLLIAVADGKGGAQVQKKVEDIGDLGLVDGEWHKLIILHKRSSALLFNRDQLEVRAGHELETVSHYRSSWIQYDPVGILMSFVRIGILCNVHVTDQLLTLLSTIYTLKCCSQLLHFRCTKDTGNSYTKTKPAVHRASHRICCPLASARATLSAAI